LVVFKIPAAVDCPVTFDKTAYIRVDSSNRELKDFSDKERKIWINQESKNFEKSVASEYDNIDKVLELLDYSNYFRMTKQSLPSEKGKFLEKMEQDKLVFRKVGDEYVISNLGALLFANDLSEFDRIKRKAVRVVIYEKDTREKIIKEQTGSKGYATAFESLINYINDKLPSNEEIQGVFREEKKMYPEIAIREFVANALIHQDLSVTGSGSLVEIFRNSIVITNPGIPLVSTERFMDCAPVSRNQDLAAFLRRVGICEELGSGVERAIINIELFQLPAPKFEVHDGYTRVTMYAHKSLKEMTSEDKVRACYQHCVLKYLQNTRMTNETLRKRLNIEKSNYPAASKIIRDTITGALIKESSKSKEYVPFWA
jgi:predicted HTH transcriptional regulator